MQSQLHQKLRQSIDTGNINEEEFSSLALQLWQHQNSTNKAYRNYCQARSTRQKKHWLDIPAIPTDAFKQMDTPLTTRSSNSSAKTFRTSGTTGEHRGEHHFTDTELYESSILSAWQSLPALEQTFFLTPSPEEAPDSSLVHMMETLRQSLCPNAPFLMKQGNLDLDPIKEAIANQQPITLLGTALAFLHIAENENLALPKGSWCMETGGYKGTGKTLPKEEFYKVLHQSLGLEPSRIWNEYSMTELSSQFYTQGLGSTHKAPSWTRIRVIDPETNLHVEQGQPGYLEIIDLANYHSVLAIRTQDIAIYQSPLEFTLIGRDPSAVPRGCSRSTAEALEDGRSMSS